jgi:hypothetical protein
MFKKQCIRIKGFSPTCEESIYRYSGREIPPSSMQEVIQANIYRVGKIYEFEKLPSAWNGGAYL